MRRNGSAPGPRPRVSHRLGIAGPHPRVAQEATRTRSYRVAFSSAREKEA